MLVTTLLGGRAQSGQASYNVASCLETEELAALAAEAEYHLSER